MSGFEIAGLVLGAFPLLLEGVKELEGLAKKFDFYWEFRTNFESFIADVNGQRIFYDLNIALLLESLDISDAERRKLQDVTQPTLWHEDHIKTELRRKVRDDHHHWLVCCLQNIAVILNNLRGLFPIDKARLLDTRDIEGVIYRLATSFSSQKDELLTALKKNNDEIHRYLDGITKVNSAAEVPARPSLRDQSQWKKYQKLQKQAHELFHSFQEHWLKDCTCSTGHPCGITIQKPQEGNGKDVSIMLMFNLLSDAAGSHVRLRVGEDAPFTEDESCSQIQSDDTAAGGDTLDVLSQRVVASNAQRKLKPQRKFSIREVWRRLSHKNDCPESKNGNVKNQSSGLLTNIKLSSRVSPEQPDASGSPSKQKLQADDTSRKVHFDMAGTEVSGEPENPDDSTPIRSLCASINCKPAKPCLGFLKSKNNQRIYLHSAPWEQPSQLFQVETLDSVIRTQVYRAKRLQVGLSTVLLVASVGASPWLSVSWTPVDLNLLRDPDTSLLQPYVVHESLLNTLKRSNPLTFQPQGRSNLFVLGIILLELLFGKKLESNLTHSAMLKDSSSRELTDFCTAMKWQEDVEPEFGKPLADAIAWCLLCFRNPGKGIGNPDCLEDMWQHVVLPLKRFLSTWE